MHVPSVEEVSDWGRARVGEKAKQKRERLKIADAMPMITTVMGDAVSGLNRSMEAKGSRQRQ